jgi:hypothetical protein
VAHELAIARSALHKQPELRRAGLRRAGLRRVSRPASSNLIHRPTLSRPSPFGRQGMVACQAAQFASKSSDGTSEGCGLD